MAKFVYKKHNVIYKKEDGVEKWDLESYIMDEETLLLYPGYRFVKSSSRTNIHGEGTSYELSRYAPLGTVAYRVFGMSFMKKVTVIEKDGKRGFFEEEYKYALVDVSYKDTYIGEVTAEEGILPDNGRHTDGFWYVKDRLANSAPVISGDAAQLGILSQDRDVKFSVSDKDNDLVTVEILIDGVRTANSPFTVTLGREYKIGLKPIDYAIGNHTVVVNATDTKGAKTSRSWYFTRANANPTISGVDEDLGDRNSGFQIPFSVDDIDQTDKLTVSVFLNNALLRTIDNVKRKQEYLVEISDGQVFALAIGETNTITITVDDNSGGETSRYKTFKRTNTAPMIDGEDKSLGSVSAPPTITFSATDNENDALTYSIFLNDIKLVGEESLTPGQTVNYTMPKKQFMQLDNMNEHKLKVVVTDIQKATALRHFTFKRKLNSCWHRTLRKVNARASAFYAYVNFSLYEGAKIVVTVCNNGLDANPKWEDATEEFKRGEVHDFVNMDKTAASWAIGMKVEILPLQSKGPSWINGYGGGYK